jgi:hypothetical protein
MPLMGPALAHMLLTLVRRTVIPQSGSVSRGAFRTNPLELNG